MKILIKFNRLALEKVCINWPSHHGIKATNRIPRNLFSGNSVFRCFSVNTGQMCSLQSFKYVQMEVSLTEDPRKPPDPSTLIFGKTYSPHMLQVEWNESKGWSRPRIMPVHSFQIYPGAKVFHYAQAVFEGMKAYKAPDGRILLFRPQLNMKRLLSSSERAALPSFDSEELFKCIKKLISIDHSWVPDDGQSSLYIRPTFIATENALGVISTKEALLYVLTGPTGPYFKNKAKPVSLLADPNFVRAWPGGTGNFKLAANYAPSFYVQKLAMQKGLDQVLWLFGDDNRISEAGAMNVFFFLKKKNGQLELVTPPLDGTILPGITRQSILELAKEWKEFEISERYITMNELISLVKENRLLEMFLCGTACIVCPVGLIHFFNNDIKIPTPTEENALYVRVLKAMQDIQYGRVKSEWSVPIEMKS